MTAEDLILQIRSQAINNPKFKQFILSIKYHLEYETNGIYYRSLLAISFIDFENHVNYIMKIIQAGFDSKLHPFTQLLLYGINRYGLMQVSAQINQLIQQLKTSYNQAYHILMQYPQAQTNPLSLDLIKEKYIIEGLNDFIAKIKKQRWSQIQNIEKCLNYDNSKQDKLFPDKIYKGFLFVKIYIDLALEIKFFYNTLTNQKQFSNSSLFDGMKEYQEDISNRFEYEIITQSYNMKDISQQQISIKTQKIVQSESQNLYRLSVQMPLLVTDYNGQCYLIVPQHFVQQLLEKQKNIIFDSFIAKQIIKQVNQEFQFDDINRDTINNNMKGFNFDNYPYFYEFHYFNKNKSLIVNPRYIYLEDPILNLQQYLYQESQVGFVKASDKIVNYKQRSTLSIDQELRILQFQQAQYDLNLIGINEKQFKDQNQLSKILRKFIDDIVSFQIKNQKIKLEWPYLILDRFKQYIFPPCMLDRIIYSTKIFELGMVNINYVSLIETYLIKWCSILESCGKQINIIDLEIVLSISFKWPLFEYIIKESIDQ
ncbi:hypothetical protein pb186bvf_021136, partial [Paramecium bursaria]